VTTEAKSGPRHPGDYFAWIAVATSVIGGVYWGLFSCGAYVWHFRLYIGIAVAFTGLAIFLPSRRGRSLIRAVALPVVVVAGFAISEALVSPFYAGSPDTLSEYGRLVLLTLRTGPC
jgi:hypothetical protein